MHSLFKAAAFLFIYCIFILSACKNHPVALTNEEKKILSDTIDKTLHEYYKAIQENGLTAEFNYLDSSAEFFWVPPGYASPLSFDSVAAAINTSAKAFTSVSNSWEQLAIHPLNNQYANYSGIIRSEMIDTSGKNTVVHLLETGLLIKRESGWKLLSGQTSIINK